MNRLFHFEGPDNFKNFLIISAVIHLSFALTMILKNLVFSSDTIVIPPSVRVDMVALPDKLVDVPAPKAAEPKPKPAPEKPKPKENKEDVLKKAKAEQEKALKKLSAMSAIDRFRNEISESKDNTPPPPQNQYKGNIISSGNSFTGISRLRVNEYLDNLTRAIREQWVLPQWLSDANLKASILMTVDSRGQLARREIYVSSGNTVFDNSCLAAIEQAAPFSPPPSEVEGNHILINFPFQ